MRGGEPWLFEVSIEATTAHDGALRGLFSTASYLFFASNSRGVIAITYDGFLARWDL